MNLNDFNHEILMQNKNTYCMLQKFVISDKLTNDKNLVYIIMKIIIMAKKKKTSNCIKLNPFFNINFKVLGSK